MKKFISISAFILLIIILLDIPSIAGGLFMGRIESVYSEGAMDVVRNPALTALVQEKNSFGMFLTYNPYYTDDMSIKSKYEMTNFQIFKSETEKNISGHMIFAYLRRHRMFTFGLSMSNRVEYYSEIENDYMNFNVLLPAPTAVHYLSKIKTETKVIIPSLTASVGLRINSKSLLGLKLSTAYASRTVEEKHSAVYMLEVTPAGDFSKETVNNYLQSYSNSLTIGFIQRIKKTEIGAMFNFGTLKWEKQSVELEKYGDIFSGLKPWKSGIEVPFHSQYSKGPGFSIGVYSNPLKNFGISFEYSIVFHNEYVHKEPSEVEFDDGNIRIYRIIEADISNDMEFALKGGMEFKLSPYIFFSLGIGYGFKEERMDYIYISNRSITTEFLCATGGVEYYFKKNSKIAVGFQFTDGKGSVDFNSINPMLIYLNVNNKIKNIEILTAITFGF